MCWLIQIVGAYRKQMAPATTTISEVHMLFRQQQSLETRRSAADLAASRPHPRHYSNGDEQRLRREDGKPSYAANFTKCLPHDAHGFLMDPRDYEEWVRAIDSGEARDFRTLR